MVTNEQTKETNLEMLKINSKLKRHKPDSHVLIVTGKTDTKILNMNKINFSFGFQFQSAAYNLFLIINHSIFVHALSDCLQFLFLFSFTLLCVGENKYDLIII